MAQLVTPMPTWMEYGACAQTDPELFYPEHVNKKSTRSAKKICRGCPVLEECFNHVQKHPEPHGVWGGTTPRERRRMAS